MHHFRVPSTVWWDVQFLHVLTTRYCLINGNPLQYSCLENPMDGGAWCPWGRKELDTTEQLHLSKCEVISHYGFDFCFFDWWCWASFQGLIGHLHVFHGEKPIQTLCLLFNCGMCLFCHRVVRILYIFQTQAPYQIYDLQIFSPILWLSFHCLDGNHFLLDNCSLVYHISLFAAIFHLLFCYLFVRICVYTLLTFSWWLRGKESACQCRRCGFDPWVRKTPGRGNGNPL